MKRAITLEQLCQPLNVDKTDHEICLDFEELTLKHEEQIEKFEELEIDLADLKEKYNNYNERIEDFKSWLKDFDIKKFKKDEILNEIISELELIL